MGSLGQDLGTAALLLFCACTLVIRARYFCTYGKEAFLVAIMYIAFTVPIRLMATHEAIEPEAARTLSGYSAAGCLVIQLTNLFLGELMYRKRKEGTDEHIEVG